MRDQHQPPDRQAGDDADSPGVDWQELESTLDGLGDADALENLQRIRDIARFNSAVQSGEDPIQSMGKGQSDEPPPPNDGDENASNERAPKKWRHLQIGRLLGEGTYAEVYLARDSRLDIDVALKLYRPWPAEGAPRGAAVAGEGDETVGAIAGGVLGGAAGKALTPQKAKVAQRIARDMCKDMPPRIDIK